MSRIILYFFFILVLGCKTQNKEGGFEWNIEKEKIHNENRNDSTKWSSENWEADTGNMKIDGNPMTNGVFPVPKYHLVDTTFSGLGNWGNWNGLNFNDRKIIYHSLYVNKHAANEEFIGEKSDEVFFTIAVLTDTVDLERYSHTYVNVSSRNHPHYIGQGFVKTKRNQIDFISFLSAERNEYAIVNMRLFDLRIGRIVLIAPQKDGTLRSLQLSSTIMSSQEMDEYFENLLTNDDKVISFFSKKGNI